MLPIQSAGEGMKFGKFILRKVIEIAATRCQILRLKCTKIDFGWGSAPDPTGGAYSALQTLLAGIKGPYFQGKGGERRRGEGREGCRKREDKEKGEEKREGRGERGDSPYQS